MKKFSKSITVLLAMSMLIVCACAPVAFAASASDNGLVQTAKFSYNGMPLSWVLCDENGNVVEAYNTNGLTVRNWLAGQSFQEQYQFGLEILRAFGVEI